MVPHLVLSGVKVVRHHSVYLIKLKLFPGRLVPAAPNAKQSRRKRERRHSRATRDVYTRRQQTKKDTRRVNEGKRIGQHRFESMTFVTDMSTNVRYEQTSPARPMVEQKYGTLA